jgi:hypothetical protein
MKEPPPPRADAPDAKKYESILAKGMLGQPPQDAPQSGIHVFGILGTKALMGPAREGIQPYEVGATLPGDEKLVAIAADAVTLEKNGKKRTLKVFDPENKAPERPKGPEQKGPEGQKGPGGPGGPGGNPNGPGGPGGPMPMGGPGGPMPMGGPGGMPPGAMPGR